MIAAIIAAVAVSAAVDTRLVNPECRIIGQQVLGHQCCESCETDFVLHTRWVTRDAAAVAKVTDVDVGSGGGVVEELEVQAAAQSVTACGQCVTVDECIAGNGHVNTWHRTCATWGR